MTISLWLSYAIDKLEGAGIATARLDSEILLADEMAQDRSWLQGHLDTNLTEETRNQLDKLLGQRVKHVPLAYIRGKTEFYGREFLIDRRVLEPRPESETIIDLLKKLPPSQGETEIIDVGTGSGALAVTAKLEFPDAKVVATDIDSDCLEVARANASKHHVHITFAQGDLLAPAVSTDSKHTIVTLANLPYVPDDYHVNLAALHEPRHAIFGGADGLDVYRKLFEQAQKLANRPRYILTEALPPQHKQLMFVAARFGFRQIQVDDFIQVFESGTQEGLQYNTAIA